MPLRCFMQEQAPVPGSAAQPVHYPACEWLGDDGTVDHRHPSNRFVCSWLTSDVNTLERCQEVLDAMAQLESGQLAQWFADGDAFCVDLSAQGVQFNQSNVGPEDTLFWNQPDGQFTWAEVKTLLCKWQDFLAQRG